MSLLVDDNELKLLFDFHTETELGEGRVPVGGQLCFLFIKSSLSPGKVVFFIISSSFENRRCYSVFSEWKLSPSKALMSEVKTVRICVFSH